MTLVPASSSRSSGGGSQPPVVVPTADVTGATLDTTTYDNPVTGGPDKLATLVFPASPPGGGQIMLAVAIEGDAFPRQLIFADPVDFNGADYGDGTTDPWNAQSAGWVIKKLDDDSYQYRIVSAADATFGVTVGNVLKAVKLGGPLTVPDEASFGFSGATFHSGTGAPAIAGNLGDLYIRKDGDPTANTYQYACTTAGAAGDAVWTALVTS